MPAFSDGLLQKKWIHSHEEDHGNEIVYRPSTYKFPPSRGRFSFELSAQGALTIGGPSPVDRITSKTASWEIDDNVLVFKEADSVIRKLRILLLNNDKLVVEDR